MGPWRPFCLLSPMPPAKAVIFPLKKSVMPHFSINEKDPLLRAGSDWSLRLRPARFGNLEERPRELFLSFPSPIPPPRRVHPPRQPDRAVSQRTEAGSQAPWQSRLRWPRARPRGAPSAAPPVGSRAAPSRARSSRSMKGRSPSRTSSIALPTRSWLLIAIVLPRKAGRIRSALSPQP